MIRLLFYILNAKQWNSRAHTIRESNIIEIFKSKCWGFSTITEEETNKQKLLSFYSVKFYADTLYCGKKQTILKLPIMRQLYERKKRRKMTKKKIENVKINQKEYERFLFCFV